MDSCVDIGVVCSQNRHKIKLSQSEYVEGASSRPVDRWPQTRSSLIDRPIVYPIWTPS